MAILETEALTKRLFGIAKFLYMGLNAKVFDKIANNNTCFISYSSHKVLFDTSQLEIKKYLLYILEPSSA
tara:strand:+ start:428 stop:637 length:210 start_codon:yes stop_codon:yes gene_type:complete